MLSRAGTFIIIMEIEREAEGGRARGLSYSQNELFVRSAAQDYTDFAPGGIEHLYHLFIRFRLFLTMPSRGRGAGFSNSDWPSGITPKRQRANSVGTPEMPAEMRLIGKTRFGRHVYDREIFFWRRQ